MHLYLPILTYLLTYTHHVFVQLKAQQCADMITNLLRK